MTHRQWVYMHLQGLLTPFLDSLHDIIDVFLEEQTFTWTWIVLTLLVKMGFM